MGGISHNTYSILVSQPRAHFSLYRLALHPVQEAVESALVLHGQQIADLMNQMASRRFDLRLFFSNSYRCVYRLSRAYQNPNLTIAGPPVSLQWS